MATSPAELSILQVDALGQLRGGQNQILLLAQGLSRLGHAVAIATPRCGPFLRMLRKEGLKIVPLPSFLPALTWSVSRAIARIRPDIIHVHDARGVVPAAVAVRLRKGVPLVVSRRVDFPARSKLFRRLKYAVGADCVVAASHRIRDRLIEEGVPSQRIRVIWDCVDLESYVIGEKAQRPRSDTGTVAAGTLSALTAEKGNDVLIEAAAILAEQAAPVRVVLGGDGPEQPRLRSRIFELRLSDTVALAGRIHDVPVYLESLDLFVHPARREGLGSAILAAMAAGLPIVASRTGGIPEAVEENVTALLVPPDDPDALAEAILAVVRDRERARAMGRAGRTRVETLFSCRRMVADTQALYSELAGR